MTTEQKAGGTLAHQCKTDMDLWTNGWNGGTEFHIHTTASYIIIFILRHNVTYVVWQFHYTKGIKVFPSTHISVLTEDKQKICNCSI